MKISFLGKELPLEKEAECKPYPKQDIHLACQRALLLNVEKSLEDFGDKISR